MHYAELGEFLKEDERPVTQDDRYWRWFAPGKWEKIPGLNAHRAHKILGTLFHSGPELYHGRLPEGVSFFGSYRDFDVRMWFSEPLWSRGLVQILAERLQKFPGTYLDIGANLGVVSSLVAQKNPGTPLIAIEASPFTAKLTARALRENKVEGAILAICAVSQEKGTAEFNFTPFHSGNASLGQTASKVRDQKVTVPVTTVDHLLAELNCPPVTVVKIDVEGFEPEVLMGAQKMLDTHRPLMCLEFNQMTKGRGITYEDVFGPIRARGYDLFWFDAGEAPVRLHPEADVTGDHGFDDVVCIPRD